MNRLRIYNQSLVFKGEMDDFEDFEVIRKYRGVETMDLIISQQKSNVDQLQKHFVLAFGNDRVAEIEHIEYLMTDIPSLRVKAFGFGKTLKKRVTVPPVGQDYDRILSSKPEFIVKEWIKNNLITAADVARRIPYLAIATNQNRGVTVTDQTRYKMLNEEVARVLSVDDLGYKFNRIGNTITFDVFTGLDRTVGNGVNPPAIFSASFDNVLDEKYIRSATTNQNTIYVGGQGTGAARTIVKVGTDTSYERYEQFVDARDTNDTVELTNRGIAAQIVDSDTLSISLDANANLRYQEDFDLGDIVTIQIPAFGLQFNQRITEVREKYTAGEPVGIFITFGVKFKTLIDNVVKNSSALTNLEVV